jgi:hypothetical protein
MQQRQVLENRLDNCGDKIDEDPPLWHHGCEGAWEDDDRELSSYAPYRYTDTDNPIDAGLTLRL